MLGSFKKFAGPFQCGVKLGNGNRHFTPSHMCIVSVICQILIGVKNVSNRNAEKNEKVKGKAFPLLN
jgi:hypothetical protein